MMLDLLAPLVVGLVGSVHCLGMCGPLVVAYSLHIRPTSPDSTFHGQQLWSTSIAHHVAFHSGRILAYGLLGALASGLTHAAGFSGTFVDLRSGVTVVGGIAMLLFGLALLRLLPARLFPLPSFRPGGMVGRAIPRLLASDRVASKWALGFTAGFLPCMLSWAMIVNAALAESVVYGFMIMSLFGLGTVPALFFTGLSASLFTLRARLAGERLAACSVIVMGVILLVKGAGYLV